MSTFLDHPGIETPEGVSRDRRDAGGRSPGTGGVDPKCTWQGLPARLDEIPYDLRVSDQWVCWESRPNGERVEKIPLRATRTGHASSTDPTSWSSFDEVAGAYEEGTGAGIGFVLTKEDPFLALDFDHVVNAQTGEIDEPVRRAIDALGTYAEISPSGTGVRIIGRGEIPEGRKSGSALQFWSHSRFVTLTGHRLSEHGVGDFDPETLAKVIDYFNPPKDRSKETPKHERVFDIAGAVEDILSGDNLHDSTRDIAASLAAASVPEYVTKGVLKGLMLGTEAREKEPGRWNERYRDIDNLVASARKFRRDDPSQIDWPEIEPLAIGYAEPVEFPLHALPDSIGKAVTEYQRYGQQPLPLVASSALATVSLVCQGHADIRRDSHLVGPISLAIFAVAESGERKSAGDRVLSRGVRNWLQKRRIEERETIQRMKGKRRAWEAKLKGKERILSTLATGVIPKDLLAKTAEEKRTPDLLKTLIAQYENEIEALQKDEPKVPRRTVLFFGNATSEGLVKELADGYPIGALWDDEAGNTVGSVGMSEDRLLGFLASINKLWDAAPITHTRSTIEDREVSGKRVTVNLMMQGDVLQKLARMEGGLARHSGFLARILLTEPISTIGTRRYVVPGRTPHLDAFVERTGKLMEMDLPSSDAGSNSIEPPILDLSQEAQEIWRQYHGEVEGEFGESGDLFDVRDFASKSAEQAARLAGCFHVFEGYGPDKPVSGDTMNRAKEIAAWYLMETLRVMNVRSTPQEIADAKRLGKWMIEAVKESYSRHDIARLGPNVLRRDRRRRDAAIAELARINLIKEIKTGNNARAYCLNPKARDARWVS